MKAYYAMTDKVITVGPETTIDEIARLFVANRISSVPVVDGENRVIGIVRRRDLLVKEKPVPFSTIRLPALFDRWIDRGRLAEAYKDARNRTASDVMETEVVSVDVREDIEDVAFLMASRELPSVPVLSDGKLAGIISRSDLIKLLTKAG